MDIWRFGRGSTMAAALGATALLSGCGGASGNGNVITSIISSITGSTPTPSPTPTPTQMSGQTQAGWRDRLLNNDGTINNSQYDYIAANYNKAEIVDYRLGPSYADLNPGTAADNRPTVPQPDPDGLWKGGTDLNYANETCRLSDGLPTSDAQEAALQDEGGGWIESGQMLYVPDANAPVDQRAGVSNMRNFDGAQSVKYVRNSDKSFKLDANGNRIIDKIALCMRMRTGIYGDWWNRNNVSAPTTPTVSRLLQQYPDLPLPAVATARGEIQNSITGFLAFQNGVIAAAGTGNDAYCNGFASGTSCETTIRLPAGKVPTALALSAMNEFLFVTVWDTSQRKGQLGVIAVGPDDPANIGPGDTGRYGWGVQSWPTIRGLKLLGFIDLPMQAPSSLSISLNTGTMKFRGFESWRGNDLNTQAGRDAWNARSLLGPDVFLGMDVYWRLLASAGYAVVGSRAENKVAIVDLRPLVDYYRRMYLTTQANWDQTANTNQGSGDNQWPYTFASRPEQRPTVLGVLSIAQPTAIYARQRRSGTNTLSGWDNNDWNALSKLVTIASMDGTVRQYDVSSIMDPTKSATMPTNPVRQWQAGANPTQIATPIAGAARTDDLFVVSRGTRLIQIFSYKGDQIATLNDKRLIDPVFVAIGGNAAGYGGRGKNYALWANVITVLDYNGKVTHDYGMFIEHYDGRYDPSRGNPNDPLSPEEWPFLAPDGRTRQPFQYGYGSPVSGRPFMFTFDEVI